MKQYPSSLPSNFICFYFVPGISAYNCVEQMNKNANIGTTRRLYENVSFI